MPAQGGWYLRPAVRRSTGVKGVQVLPGRQETNWKIQLSYAI